MEIKALMHQVKPPWEINKMGFLNLNKQTGQAFILALIVLTVVTIGTIMLISGSLTIKENSRFNLDKLDATNLAEAGIDKAVAALNKSGGSYNGESETALGGGSYSVTITTVDPTTKLIQATGYLPNKTNPKVKRSVQIQVSKGTGISFVYGILTGNGGITMGNGSVINGSIYSNGNIVGGNTESITGDVYVAGGAQPTADQQGDCTSPNCQDFIFGKNVSGDNRLDVAQSFKPTITAVLNKVSLKLKKIGSPPNLTVRILGDNLGQPNKNNILASGTLPANLVTTQYGFVDVTFSSNPTLTANTSYWILLDASSDSSNYWAWSMDSLKTYTNGSPAWSPNWQAGMPVWTNIDGDLGFKTWMGGVVTSISMGNGSVIGGNVHANTINGITVQNSQSRGAFYQTQQNLTVNGQNCTSDPSPPKCNPNSTDPPSIAMPISDANIADWKDQASPPQAPLYSGDINGCPATLGPGKFDGNITTSSNCTITVKTPIWITKNLTFGNSAIFKMDPSLGASSGVIIVDGTTTFSNSDDILGTGTSGSYLALLSTINTLSSGLDAIKTGNSSITGILYAPYGSINLANNANFKEVVAWKIIMGNGTVLTYDSGLISTFFSAGPSGSFTPIKGTYLLK